MKFSRKNFFLLLLLLVAAVIGAYFWHQYALSRLPVIGLHKNEKGGYTFAVDGRPFLVRGVCYNPIPVGKDYEYNFWSDPGKPWLADGKLMKEMGVNAVRLYRLPEKDSGSAKKGIHDLYTKFGIRSFVGHYLGFWDWPPANYSNTGYRDNMKRRVIEMVKLYKDEPGIAAWILGNENNYSFDRNLRVWSDERIDGISDPEQRRIEMAKVYYAFVNDIALEVKKVDPSRPVILGVGEVKSLDIAAEKTPDIDIIGMIAYRGATFGNLFRQVKKLYDKPLLITEYGADRFNAYTREEDQASQARFLELQWRDIERNSTAHSMTGNAIGGIIFEWSDEWWKANENLAHTWTIQDQSAQWSHSGYYYDYEAPGRLNINEEWWGVVGLKVKPGSLKEGIDKRLLTEGYRVMKGLWTGERKDPPALTGQETNLISGRTPEVAAGLAGALSAGETASTASSGESPGVSSATGGPTPSAGASSSAGSGGGSTAATGAGHLGGVAPAIVPPGREWGNTGWVNQPNSDGSVSLSGPTGEKVSIPSGSDAFTISLLGQDYSVSVTPRQELILEPKGADIEPLQSDEAFEQKTFDASGSQTGLVTLVSESNRTLSLIKPGSMNSLAQADGGFVAFLTERGYPVLVSGADSIIKVPAGAASFTLASAAFSSRTVSGGGIGVVPASEPEARPIILTVGAFQPVVSGGNAFMGTVLADGSLIFIPAGQSARVVYPSGDMLRPIKVSELSSGRFALESGGRVFVVQGVRYQFTPIGKGSDYRVWRDTSAPWREDARLMRDAGVNTVVLDVFEEDDFTALRELVGALGSEYGIRSIVQYRAGERRASTLDFSDPKTREKLAKALNSLVETMKSEPALLGWIVGRSANLAWEDGSVLWRSPNFDRIVDATRRKSEMQKTYFAFAEELARLIRLEDAGRPVWVGLTEVASLAAAEKQIASASGFAVEVGVDDLTPFFEAVQQSTARPVLVMGFGGDRWSAVSAKEDESHQAELILTQWNEIEKRTALREGASPALGGVLNAWTDSWWPASQNTASWSSQDAPSGEMAVGQSEWSGIIALEPALAGSGQADRRVPQEGYQAIKKLWSSASPIDTASSAFTARSANGSWISALAGKEQLVRGVLYRPIPAGQGGAYDFWADPEKPWLADGKLLKAMGANAVLIELPSDRRSDARDLVRDLFEQYGIQTFVSFSLAGGENRRSLSLAAPEDQKIFETQVLDTVRSLRGEPGLAGWILGRSENRSFDFNLNPWSSPAWDSIRDGEERRRAIAQAYYLFMDRVAGAVKKEDPSRSISLGLYETRSLDIAARHTPHIDALAVTARRGLAFGSLFGDIRKAYDKPVLIYGFGADRWNTLAGAEDEDSQAWFVSVQWRDIVRHSSAQRSSGANSVGGFVCEWTDEWWRSDPDHPTTWSVQDKTAQSTEPVFDYDYEGSGHLNVQEEWWGITARDGKTVSPRKAYYTLQGLWTEDQAPSAVCPAV